MKMGEIFKISLYGFSRYNKLLLVSGLKTAVYVLLLSLIMLAGIAIKISPVYIVYGGIEALVQKEVSDFKIEDGRLECKAYKYDDPSAGLYISIDPSVTGKAELPHGYSQAAAVTATDVVMLNNGRVQHEKLKDLPDVSKSDIVDFFDKYEGTLLIVLSLFLLWLFSVKLAWNALFYALLAHITNLTFLHTRLKYGDIYKLSIFGSTFAVIFNTLLSLVNVGFVAQLAPFITMFYVIKGMLACRAEDGIIIETLDTPDNFDGIS